MEMDVQLRGYLLMALVALVSASVVMIIGWSVWSDDSLREYAAYGGFGIGAAAGILVLFLFRRRTTILMTERVLCETLRDVASVLSFLSVVPALMSLIIALAFPESDPEILIILSAAMIVISMIVQAVFWHHVDDIGSMSTVSNIMLVILLILTNVAAIISLDNGHPVMLVVASLAAVLPIILMMDWSWSVDLTMIGLLICSVVATIMSAINDFMQFGNYLTLWIPLLFLFLIRNRMRVSFLMNDGKKLF